jgi:glycosyltransferase involved in cell wall biosynthesis
MPAWPATDVEADADVIVRGSVRVGFVGNIVPSKRIGQLLAAFVRLRSEHPDAVLVLAGAARGVDLESRLAALDLERDKDVLVLGHLDEDRLWSVMASCDICVSLRWPTMGETSGIVLRTLSAGRPLVVSDVGSFSELPDSVVVKVPVDEWEVDTLAAVLGRLAAEPPLRERMGAAARAYAEREHALPRVADAYATALGEAAGAEPVREAVLREVAEAAAGVGLHPDGDATRELAERLREVGV